MINEWQDQALAYLDRATMNIGTSQNLLDHAKDDIAKANELVEANKVRTFIDRSEPGLAWRKVFEDDFTEACAEGQFLAKYGAKWTAYPTTFATTSKRGYYDPNRLSVITDTENTALRCRLVPGKSNANGKPSGVAPCPKFEGQSRTKGEIIEARIKVVRPAAGWHAANLGWPPVDSDWPKNGEADWWESGLTSSDKVGGYLHVQGGGPNSEGQVPLKSPVPVTDWFVVTAERIAATSYKWSVNHTEYAMVTKAVPAELFRWVLQLEDGGTPTDEAIVLYDWLTIWVPA